MRLFLPAVTLESGEWLSVTTAVGCDSHSPEDEFGEYFRCTREPGHPEDHAAHTSRSQMVAKWPLTKEENRLAAEAEGCQVDEDGVWF